MDCFRTQRFSPRRRRSADSKWIHLIQTRSCGSSTPPKEDPDFACFLVLAATTGARRGELCALRWSAINLREKPLTIGSAVVEGVRRQLFEKDTKTHGSRRIAIDDLTLATLQTHFRRREERARNCGAVLIQDAFACFARS